jgi:hypothetical protein
MLFLTRNYKLLSLAIGKSLFLCSKTLIKLGIVQQFMMEQSGQLKDRSVQKERQPLLQSQSSLSICLVYLLDVRNYMNILDCYQFQGLLMITIII